MTRAVVVGGGAAGVLAAVALAACDTVTSVVVVERGERVGPGLAYGRAQPHHLLNSLAGRMSAVAADPDHFVQWCEARGLSIGPHDFAPRLVYGDYLAAVFADLLRDPSGRVRAVRGEVTAVQEAADGLTVRLVADTALEADVAVLAVGNPPPASPLATAPTIPDPWAHGALDEVGDDDRVLLIGTGLTAVDAATTLARRGIRTTATSRALLLPRVHVAHHAPPGPGLPQGLSTLDEVVAAFDERIRIARAEGRPWQAEVDGVRPQVNTLWAALDLADRQRFVARFSRQWEVRRHRMAPAVAAEIDDLLAHGTLRLEADADPTRFDVVIDCTGPRPVATPGWSPVVAGLLQSGAARPDALGIGLDVTDGGALRNQEGEASQRLFALGTARRGSQWESTAIPEIRQHAQTIADALVR